MLEALSTSRWKWTWRFLLLALASVVVFAACVAVGGQYRDASTVGAVFGAIAFLCVAGLAVGVIGAIVTFVMTMLRRHSPPAKPAA